MQCESTGMTSIIDEQKTDCLITVKPAWRRSYSCSEEYSLRPNHYTKDSQLYSVHRSYHLPCREQTPDVVIAPVRCFMIGPQEQ